MQKRRNMAPESINTARCEVEMRMLLLIDPRIAPADMRPATIDRTSDLLLWLEYTNTIRGESQ
jgi:hypothetical protein